MSKKNRDCPSYIGTVGKYGSVDSVSVKVGHLCFVPVQKAGVRTKVRFSHSFHIR